jgi:NTE family protein
MLQTFPFKNLVFQGGGAKTYAYHGALEILEQQGILEQIQRVAGSSAGATLAAALSFRLDTTGTFALFRRSDFGEADENGESKKRAWIAEKELNRLRGGVSSVNRLLSRYGWRSVDRYQRWIEGLIAPQCDDNGRATFADFQARGFRDLYIVTTNISTHSTEIFSAERTPAVAVADAILMSSLVPLYFESLRFDGWRLGRGDFHADGGILLNYPIKIFDDPAYVEDERWFFGAVNWETLGCRTYRQDPRPREVEPISNVIGYMGAVFETLLEAQAVAFENNAADRFRTINISDCGVSTMDLSIRIDENDPRYYALCEAGRQATRAYLEQYVPPAPPTPPQADIIAEPTVWEKLQNGVRERWRALGLGQDAGEERP